MKMRSYCLASGVISAIALTYTQSAIAQEIISNGESKIQQSSTIAEPLAKTSQSSTITTLNVVNNSEKIVITLDDIVDQISQPQIISDINTIFIDFNNLKISQDQEFIQINPHETIQETKAFSTDEGGLRIIIIGKNQTPEVNIASIANDLTINIATENPTFMAQNNSPDIEVFSTQEAQPESYFTPNSTTGTGTQTPLIDVPQSIQVIPERVIDDRNVQELGDALETIPGVVSAGGRGTSGFGPGFTIRGFRTNENLYRNGIPYFSLAPLQTDDLASVDVLKGPASILYGAAEPGGIVNLTPKQPLENPFAEISATVGSFDNYKGAIDLSGPLNEDKTVKYRFNLAYRNYGSFRDFVEGRSIFISPTITWDISPQTSLNIYAQYFDISETNDEGIPVSENGIIDLPRNRFLGEDFAEFSQQQFTIGYNFEHQFNDNLAPRHNLQYLNYTPLRYIPFFDDFPDEQTGELPRLAYAADGNYNRLFTDAKLESKFNTGNIEHQLLLGVEYQHLSERPGFQFSDPYPSINIFNPVYTRVPYDIENEFFRDDFVNRFAVYIQDQIKFSNNLIFLGGLRYDHAYQFRTAGFVGDSRDEFEQTDSKISPRFGLVYKPIPNVSLYTSYTSSFRPSFGASRNGDGSSFEPETGQQWEVGVKADLLDRLSVTAAFFDIKKQNISTDDPTNPLLSIQTGEQTSRGFEVFVNGEVLPGWNVIGGFSHLDAFVNRDNSGFEGNILDNAPSNQFSLWTTYEVQEGNYQGLGFGLGLFYVGERQGTLDNTYILPSYFRTDLALFYKRDNWDAQVNIENLFDTNYFESGEFFSARPGAPFTVSGKFSWRF
ncbi:TonB-dependent siderophore receptor [Cyanobacterium stanieri]|uniref:TonB-dependent siderophore receptor n=1 Tax=Cyanobacterium stanieri TaxID=102235 RepID=UPI001F51376C|nr:TonB-dependent siderophore receptor [Cyanobacterium stanieri]